MRFSLIALTTAALISVSTHAFSAAATTTPAPAATAVAPAGNSNVAAKETPWTVSCQPETSDVKTADGKAAEGKVNCEVTKQVVTQDNSSVIAQISVFKNAQDVMMRVLAPHQLNIQAGLGVSIDDKDAGTKPFTTSLPSGIVALFVLDDAILPIIRKGQSLRFSVKTRANQDVSFALSLNGFAASLDKMAK